MPNSARKTASIGAATPTSAATSRAVLSADPIGDVPPPAKPRSIRKRNATGMSSAAPAATSSEAAAIATRAR